jgi:hypothetical protein
MLPERTDEHGLRKVGCRWLAAVSFRVLQGNEVARNFYGLSGFEPDGLAKVIEIGGESLTEVRLQAKLDRR